MARLGIRSDQGGTRRSLILLARLASPWFSGGASPLRFAFVTLNLSQRNDVNFLMDWIET